jgi:hypothetical protein
MRRGREREPERLEGVGELRVAAQTRDDEQMRLRFHACGAPDEP